MKLNMLISDELVRNTVKYLHGFSVETKLYLQLIINIILRYAILLQFKFETSFKVRY